jgi:hypothetical protein
MIERYRVVSVRGGSYCEYVTDSFDDAWEHALRRSSQGFDTEIQSMEEEEL